MDEIAKKNLFNKIIDYIGLGSVGVICFLYSLYWSNFAEIHINLPFLDFPIFVGEILLFWCVFLLMVRWGLVKIPFTRTYWLLLLYVAWILIGALFGYVQWGPLALRNAALFYYPLFAVVGYHFYQGEIFRKQILVYVLFLLLVLVRIVEGEYFVYYFFIPYVLLSLVLILKMNSKIIRYLALVLLLCSLSYTTFFDGSRTFIIASFGTFLFTFLVYMFGMLRISRKVKIVSLSLFVLAMIFIFFNFTPSQKVKSLVNASYVVEEYKKYDELIEENKKSYVKQDIKPQIYNINKKEILTGDIVEEKRISMIVYEKVFMMAMSMKENIETAFLSQQELIEIENMYRRNLQLRKDEIRKMVFQSSDIDYEKMVIFNREFGEAMRASVSELVKPKEITRDRTIRTEYANIIFRILIWRDMVKEVVQERAWFGFGFGKPQRSVSIENSGFADGEWGRDGWIAPHNVYLHVIYRAGIFGAVMLIYLFCYMYLMTKNACVMKSLIGLLLVSTLVYWLLCSVFLVVLELPYQGIPFWALFGMTLAYFFKSNEPEGHLSQ